MGGSLVLLDLSIRVFCLQVVQSGTMSIACLVFSLGMRALSRLDKSSFNDVALYRFLLDLFSKSRFNSGFMPNFFYFKQLYMFQIYSLLNNCLCKMILIKIRSQQNMQEQQKKSEEQYEDYIQYQLATASNFLKQNYVAQFHRQYTIATVRKKLQSGQVEIIPKLLQSSVKIFQSLYSKIQRRKGLLLEASELLKNQQQISDHLIEKIKDCTTKFIRDIGYWTKVVGYDSDNPKREFIHNGENYIGVCLIDNRFILEKKKDSYADLAVNPLFLKKGEEKLQQNQKWLQIIEMMKKMSEYEKSILKEKVDQSINEQKDQAKQQKYKQKHQQKEYKPKEQIIEQQNQDEEQEEEKKQQQDIVKQKNGSHQKEEQKEKDSDPIADQQKANELLIQPEDSKEQQKSDQSLHEKMVFSPRFQNDHQMLEHYKMLAGQKKGMNRYRKTDAEKPRQKIETKSNNRSIKSPVSLKIEKMKNRASSSKKIQDRTKDLVSGLTLVNNIREQRIKLITQKYHEVAIDPTDKRTLQEQIYMIQNTQSMSKINFPQKKPKSLQDIVESNLEKKKMIPQIEKSKPKPNMLNELKYLKKRGQYSHQKDEKYNQINRSLSKLKSRIKRSSSNSWYKNKNSSTYFKKTEQPIKISSEKSHLPSIVMKRQFEETPQSLHKKSRAISQKKSQIQAKQLEIDKKESQLESISQKKPIIEKQVEENSKSETQKQNKKLQSNISNKMSQKLIDGGLINKKKQLQSIIEDIQNQNIQKIEEIKTAKEKQKKIAAKIQQKRNKIEELEGKVRQYEKQSSNVSEKEDLIKLQGQKKEKVEQLEEKKKSFLKNSKQLQQKMLLQQEKFVDLKQKQMKLRESDLQEKYSRYTEEAITNMKNTIESLENKISQQERNRKKNEIELQDQLQRNSLIQSELEKQNELEQLLLERIKAITQKRKSEKQKQKQRKRIELEKQIQELDSQHKETLLEYERESQRLGTMFEAMRKKNSELEAKIKARTKEKENDF